MTFTIHKAERKQAKLRMGLAAASGAGKTMSALLMASGMTEWSKIYLIDTESGSADLYAHLGAYNVLTLPEPHTPENYNLAIQACEQAGAEVIVIDSVSHLWERLLEEHSKLTGNSFSNWRFITPRYDSFVKKILNSPCHIITTTRKKSDYSMDKDASGKTVISKMGLKEINRDTFDFDLTLNFALDQNHLATADKDRTGLFMGLQPFKITPETGKMLLDWCNSGAAPDLTKTVELAQEVMAPATSHLKDLLIELKKQGAEDAEKALLLLNIKIGTEFKSLELTDKQAKTALIKLLQSK